MPLAIMQILSLFEGHNKRYAHSKSPIMQILLRSQG
jgi:hypothetical protein